MAKKNNRQFYRLLKQILLLAMPLILNALKKRRAAPGQASPKSKPPVVTTRRKPETTAPVTARAKKRPSTKPLPSPPPPARPRHKPSPIAELHRDRRSDVIVTDTGTIVKVLPDDNEGSRHQRFLVDVDHTSITIKIAHNIDLAPRVPACEGDRLTFKGEYEYNDLGGALHWTHHDPKRWRDGGWIEHNARRYE